ncbi:MAG: DsrE/DsrF/DrsH-like family protein [Candidatus Kariarchaeaceae archaeon]
MSEEEEPFVLSILIKSGTYNDFMTLALLASGAIASDFEVRIFAMNDAVWALRKDVIGTDVELHSHFPKYKEALKISVDDGKVMPWWSLLADLKDMGELTITACALVADVVGLHKEDFTDLVDEIAGVAAFAGDIEESDQVIVL